MPKDDITAARCYKYAAKADIAEGWFHLGIAYMDGLGVPQNDYKAFNCFKEAADLGSEDGLHNVTVYYQQGLRIFPKLLQEFVCAHYHANRSFPAA